MLAKSLLQDSSGYIARKRFALAAIPIVIFIIYGLLVEPFWIEIRHIKICDPDLAPAFEGLTIVQVSDIHLDGGGVLDKLRQQRLSVILSRLSPDLILLTGDYAQWGADPRLAIDFVSTLRATYGVYGVLGDADYSYGGPEYCQFCHPSGDYQRLRMVPRFLDKDWTCMDQRSSAFAILGLSIRGGEEEPSEIARRLSEIDIRCGREIPIIILAHSSALIKELTASERLKLSKRPALILSGDTHGGQIRLPVWFWRLTGLKPDPDHMTGLYRLDSHLWLYVNRGIGTTIRLPFRIGVRPEVTVFRFERDEEKTR